MMLSLIAALACPYPFDDLVVSFEGRSVIAPPEAVAALPVEGATRAFVVSRADGSVIVGIEKDGCTLPPVIIPAPDTLA